LFQRSFLGTPDSENWITVGKPYKTAFEANLTGRSNQLKKQSFLK
jgi:hypothetical protein